MLIAGGFCHADHPWLRQWRTVKFF